MIQSGGGIYSRNHANRCFSMLINKIPIVASYMQPLDCASQGRGTVSAHTNNTGQRALLWCHCPNVHLPQFHRNEPRVGRQKDAAVIKIPVRAGLIKTQVKTHTQKMYVSVCGTHGRWLIAHMYTWTYLLPLPLYFIFMLHICVCILYTS